MYKKILSATLALLTTAFLVLSMGSNLAAAKGDGGSSSGGGGSSSNDSSSAGETRDSGMDSARDIAERGAGSVSETRDSGLDSARDIAERGAGSVSETRGGGMDSARDILERGTGVRLLDESGRSSNSGPGSVNSGRGSDRITTRGGAIEIRDAIIKSISSDGTIKATIGDRTFDINSQNARLKQRDVAGDVPFSIFKVGDPIRVRGTVSANGNVISATRVTDRRLPVGILVANQRIDDRIGEVEIEDIRARLEILLNRVRVLQVDLGRREDRRADRQADRQLNRQEDRQADRQADRQLNRQEDRQLDRRNP